MCLHCGYVACGRYDQGHALKHSQKFTDSHDVCINTNILSVYCYKCDEFVINDTSESALEWIRNELREGDSISDGSSETSSTLEEISSSKSSTTSQETASTSSSISSDSGWDEPAGRKLRPRKRTTSSDSTENPTKKKALKRVVGLRNLGNTCFMNSVLQSLSNIQEFSCYFNTLPALETKQKRAYHSRSMKENLDDVFVVEELRKVLHNLSKGGDGHKGAISPECLFLVIWKVVPQFRGHRQHDAHEFLRYMLDRLHTELQQVSFMQEMSALNNKETLSKSPLSVNLPTFVHNTKTRTSIVTNVFGGILQSEVRCLICGMESKKHDPFLDLSLDIPERFYKEEEMDSKPACNISDCLSSFTEVCQFFLLNWF